MKNEGPKVVIGNLVGMAVIITWTVLVANVLFGLLNQLGVLRVDKEIELNGMDISCHGGNTYNLNKKVKRDSMTLNHKMNFNLGNPFTK